MIVTAMFFHCLQSDAPHTCTGITLDSEAAVTHHAIFDYVTLACYLK